MVSQTVRCFEENKIDSFFIYEFVFPFPHSLITVICFFLLTFQFLNVHFSHFWCWGVCKCIYYYLDVTPDFHILYWSETSRGLKKINWRQFFPCNNIHVYSTYIHSSVPYPLYYSYFFHLDEYLTMGKFPPSVRNAQKSFDNICKTLLPLDVSVFSYLVVMHTTLCLVLKLKNIKFC